MNADDLIQLADYYENKCRLIKEAKIKKLPNGKYQVQSEKGKNMGTYKSKDSARKRLRAVEYFKHFDHSSADDKDVIDLTDIDEFAYSAIMRKLRQKAAPEQVRQFLTMFKKEFDKALKGKLHKPEKIALQLTMVKFNKLHKVKLDKKMLKTAAVAELGSAEQVGKYLSDIVRFTLQRLPPEKQQPAIDNLKQKFAVLPASEIASKQMPQYSALGQAITFVKHVLFNHDATYVRDVLNSLVRFL